MALLATGCFAMYASAFVLTIPLRPLVRRHTSPVPEEIRGRKSTVRSSDDRKRKVAKKSVEEEEDEETPLIVDKSSPGSSEQVSGDRLQAKNRIGYLSLPPELRHQILQDVLVTGHVYPYGGFSVHETWLRDFKYATTAHRQAWKNFLRHPNNFLCCCLGEAIEGYFDVFFYTPTLCISAVDIGPHILSTCRTAYEEGHHMFYSQNTFHIPHGPLSITKSYFDRLRPEHKRLIRRIVLDMNLLDLTVEAFDNIETQLRSKNVAHGKLPHDKSVDDWVAPVAYSIISTWRSKLAWLRSWTWLEQIEISPFVQKCNLDQLRLPTRYTIPDACCITIEGGDILEKALKGIGPAEPHVPMLDCYGEAHPFLAKKMRRDEDYVWSLLELMIEGCGWKCSKALIRKDAYKDTAPLATNKKKEGEGLVLKD
ncbi:MAG: hypothetical protein Q9222_003029 [Ikaeria aurantiellina]